MIKKEDFQKFLISAIKISMAFILLTPLVLAPFTLSLSNVPKIIYFNSLVQLIFIFYLFLVLLDLNYLPKVSPLIFTVFLFLIVSAFSAFLGFNPYRSFFSSPLRLEGIIYHFYLFLFFLILTSVFNKKEDWLALFKITLVVSGLSSLAGLLQKIGIFTFYGRDLANRISGTLSNPDFFGFYIALTIFLALFIIHLEKNKALKIFWLAIAVLNCYTLFLSATRGAWIGFMAGIIFLAFYFAFNFLKKGYFQKRILFLSLFIIVLLIFLIVLNFDFSANNNYLFNRFLSIFSPDVLAGRLDIWRLSLEAFKDRPITGWGPESFSFVFDKYFKGQYLSSIPESVYFDSSHNKILELMTTTGILGTLSYISIFIVIFYLLFKKKNWLNLSSRQFTKNRIGSGSFILASFFLAYFIINLTSFDTPPTYLVFFLVLAFVNNNYSFKRMSEIKPPSIMLSSTLHKLRIIKLFIIVILIFCSLIILYQVNLKPILASVYFTKGIKLENVNPELSLTLYKKGISQKTIFDKDFKLTATERLVYILENSWAKDKETQREIIETLSGFRFYFDEYLETYDQRYLDYHKYLALIYQKIYLFNKDIEALESTGEILERALGFNDQKPEFYRLLAEVEVLKGNYQLGQEFFQKAFELTPKSYQDKSNYYKYLGIAYLKAEDKQKAGENFKKVLDREYYFVKLNPSGDSSFIKMKKDLVFAQQVANFYYFELNDFETCQEIYQRAIEIYPLYKDELQSQFDIIKQRCGGCGGRTSAGSDCN